MTNGVNRRVTYKLYPSRAHSNACIICTACSTTPPYRSGSKPIRREAPLFRSRGGWDR